VDLTRYPRCFLAITDPVLDDLFRVPDLGEKPPEEWRWIFEQYDRLRELERPRVLPMLRALILWLQYDAETLYRAALQLQIGAPAGEVVTLSNLGAGGVRERLAVRGFDARYLLFTEGHLDRLAAQLALIVEALRAQAWWLDVAAESVAAWIETYHERQRELRAHARGRAPSVGLAFLVDQTLECRPSEVARRLVEARVLPEREGEHDDLQVQWLQLLKRARTRFRRRNGL